MWQLIKLKATNICAFEQLEYSPIQNQATLVFGNNLDNDSQNSNGSGKSALIETLAIGILGEPLRKVNIDEIINDRFDEATVSISLYNQVTNEILVIARTLFRKKTQNINIVLTSNNNKEEIKQASVADYNKYVLDQIGLSKDDILHNFILTARKYQSFLSSSDKDKKEIINRFSNGVMVDESINNLLADIEPLQQKLLEAENNVAKCTGRVSALSDEIERIINENLFNKNTIQERIATIKDVIANKRNDIRDWNKLKESTNAYLGTLTDLEKDMQALEKSNKDITIIYEIIAKTCFFHKIELSNLSDYVAKIKNNYTSLDKTTAQIQQLNEQSETLTRDIIELEKEVATIYATNQRQFKCIDEQAQKLDEEICQLRQQVIELKNKSKELTQQRTQINQIIADLEKQLAGVIECPKCHHEFTLSNNIDISRTRNQLNTKKDELKTIENNIEKIDSEYTICVDKGKSKSNEQTKLNDKKQPLQQAYNEAKFRLANIKNEQRIILNDIETAKTQLRIIQDNIGNLRQKMFDEVFDIIDTVIKNEKRDLTNIDKDIQIAIAAIDTYEEQIKQIQTESNKNELQRLKDSKAKYEQDLKQAVCNKEAITIKLNTLKTQEAIFVEFKTYLANTKINAISLLTNDFLEAIGSDIRIKLSGYTILKSGKVRDKISVSLIRDGLDCGSFDKFSAGEKCRVELANVLALHKLSNVNCEEGKGLNLLVIDEILDCTDETGLANVFKALNDTQITALVVSHGNIAENYPNRLVVTKQNGVSTINGNSEQ